MYPPDAKGSIDTLRLRQTTKAMTIKGDTALKTLSFMLSCAIETP